jgi:hypothetical protein
MDRMSDEPQDDKPQDEQAPVRRVPEVTAPDVDLTTADQILGVQDYKIKRVPIPEWGGHVYVRTLTGEQRDRFETRTMLGAEASRENVRAKFLVEALCDKDGNSVFTPEQVDALGKKSAAGLTRAYNAAADLSVLSDEDLEDLAKNSGSGHGDTSSSA